MIHLAGNFTGNLFFAYSDRLEIMRMVVVLGLGLALCIQAERKPSQIAVTPMPV